MSDYNYSSPQSPMRLSHQIMAAIRKSMADNHVKQKDLAKALGVSDARISQILNYHSNITLETLDRIDAVINGLPVPASKRKGHPMTTTDALREALKPLSHDAAIDALCGCAATVTVLSYQEAIEGYLALRGIALDELTTLRARDVPGEAREADAEAAAWDWMDKRFFNLEAGHDPNDRVYGADEMVDAFMAGRECGGQYASRREAEAVERISAAIAKRKAIYETKRDRHSITDDEVLTMFEMYRHTVEAFERLESDLAPETTHDRP